MENSGKMQKPKEFSDTRKIMLSYICMLSALAVMSVYTYGIRSLAVILISVVTASVCKKICEEISKSSYPGSDLSGLVTGFMTALLLPADIPLYVPVVTSVFGILVCTLPFGTSRNSPFVPAAASICFAYVCFGDIMFTYPGIVNGISNLEKSGTSLTSLLSAGTSVKLNSAVVLEIITGQMPSAMGTGFVAVLLGALIFLLIRYPKNAIPAVTFLISTSLFAILFPRVKTGALTSFTMEICGGIILFAAVFFMSYPSVLPTRSVSAAVWGFVSGIVCMTFRYFGKFEDSAVFGILIMNGAAGFFDELPLMKFEKKKLDDSTPFREVSDDTGVVPIEVLNEIPDMTEEEIMAQDEDSSEDTNTATQEDLHSAFEPHNEINETTETPLNPGGDGNE